VMILPVILNALPVRPPLLGSTAPAVQLQLFQASEDGVSEQNAEDDGRQHELRTRARPCYESPLNGGVWGAITVTNQEKVPQRLHVFTCDNGGYVKDIVVDGLHTGGKRIRKFSWTMRTQHRWLH